MKTLTVCGFTRSDFEKLIHTIFPEIESFALTAYYEYGAPWSAVGATALLQHTMEASMEVLTTGVGAAFAASILAFSFICFLIKFW